MEVDDVEESSSKGEEKVYLPGQEIGDEEELVCDYSAYVMYHQAQTGAPCLSFDVIEDDLGDSREDFPLTCYVVAGTQAERAHTNDVIVLKMSNLCKTDEEDSDDDSDEEGENLPELEAATIRHTGEFKICCKLKTFSEN